MSIAEFDVPPSWSLDERETRVTTKFPTGLKKHRETVTASLCLVAGRGRILKPPVNKKKKLLESRKYDIDYALLCICELQNFFKVLK